MARLRPYPFGALIELVFDELRTRSSLFGIPLQRLGAGRRVLGGDGPDLSVSLCGRRVASPLGPAAGPHTQMAQNLVLAWAAGARVFELKTVQARDDLEIPRPCIDMRTVGYNVEWSQELRLTESLDEYVKGAMLIAMLEASGLPGDAPRSAAGPPATARSSGKPLGDCLFDMSVGYDLAGIRSAPVGRFIDRLRDARETIERLRAEIPRTRRTPAGVRLCDLEYPDTISDSVTLSTFHGCPAGEIERIVEWLVGEKGLHCVVKLNPTLLGREEVEHLLHDVLGYQEIRVAREAFEAEATFEEAVAICERQSARAARQRRHFGVKLTNTLVVENRAGFLPSREKHAYLSGKPLHLLAMRLVGRFRDRFQARLPISFSAGIDRHNVTDALSLGLAPVTACSDLLAPGGHGRLGLYYREIERRMEAIGARTLDDLVRSGPGSADPGDAGPVIDERADLSAGICRNTRRYLEALLADERCGRSRNRRPPRRIDHPLAFLDCLTCDLCINVCPNGANFAFHVDSREYRRVTLRRTKDAWAWCEAAPERLEHDRQIGNFADFCNDCGNCDTFCPEQGAPYRIKPRFFGTEAAWRADSDDGIFLRRRPAGDLLLARHRGRVYRLETRAGRHEWSGPGYRVSFEAHDPEGTVAARGPETIDLTDCFILDAVRRGVLDPDRPNPVLGLGAIRETGETER